MKWLFPARRKSLVIKDFKGIDYEPRNPLQRNNFQPCLKSIAAQQLLAPSDFVVWKVKHNEKLFVHNV